MGLLLRRRQRSEPILDLRDAPPPIWGRAGRCPRCDGIGYLDHLDMVRRVMHQHCVECEGTWQTLEEETLVH
jgi:hypothetical protein